MDFIHINYLDYLSWVVIFADSMVMLLLIFAPNGINLDHYIHSPVTTIKMPPHHKNHSYSIPLLLEALVPPSLILSELLLETDTHLYATIIQASGILETKVVHSSSHSSLNSLMIPNHTEIFKLTFC